MLTELNKKVWTDLDALYAVYTGDPEDPHHGMEILQEILTWTSSVLFNSRDMAGNLPSLVQLIQCAQGTGQIATLLRELAPPAPVTEPVALPDQPQGNIVQLVPTNAS